MVAAALVTVCLQCWAHTEGRRRRGGPPEGELPWILQFSRIWMKSPRQTTFMAATVSRTLVNTGFLDSKI